MQDMSIPGISGFDGREIEVVANGLPLWGGAQLAVDTTLVCSLSREGEPRPETLKKAGAAMAEARKRKKTRYPELQGARCRLVVTAMKVGGRWSEEAHDFVADLAAARARYAPRLLKASAY